MAQATPNGCTCDPRTLEPYPHSPCPKHGALRSAAGAMDGPPPGGISSPLRAITLPSAPIMSVPGYERLAGVLQRAYDQAASGKGKERHASDGVAFEHQPMSAINQNLGSIDGFLYQAAKKAQEARRLPVGRAQAELLGAINYLAGAVIALDTWAADTLPGAATPGGV